MGELLFPLIPLLIIATVVALFFWGSALSILFDHGFRLNSWVGVVCALFGVALVVCLTLLGLCTVVQPPWETVYAPLTKETARFGHIVAFANGIAWLGPHLTGAALLWGAWWLWTRWVRDHFYYVRDTRWNKSAN